MTTSAFWTRILCFLSGHPAKGLQKWKLERLPRPGDKRLCYPARCARCGVRGYVFVDRTEVVE